MVILLGLLLLHPFVVSASDEKGDGTDDVKVYLSIVVAQNSSLIVASSAQKPPIPIPDYPVHPDDQHWLDKLQDLPYSEAPYEGAPVLRRAPEALSGELLQQLSEQLQVTQSTPVDGLTTAGQKIVWIRHRIENRSPAATPDSTPNITATVETKNGGK